MIFKTTCQFPFVVFFLQLFRHGDRNINRPHSKSLYKNESYWPGGFGLLTNVNILSILSEKNRSGLAH